MRLPRPRFAAWPIACLLLGMGGCQCSAPLRADKHLLAFLAPGVSRGTVLEKLGEPSARFEQGRILSYRIGDDEEKGYFVLEPQVRPPPPVQWPHALRWEYPYRGNLRNLVLVFDEQGSLVRQSTVEIQ